MDQLCFGFLSHATVHEDDYGRLLELHLTYNLDHFSQIIRRFARKTEQRQLVLESFSLFDDEVGTFDVDEQGEWRVRLTCNVKEGEMIKVKPGIASAGRHPDFSPFGSPRQVGLKRM